MNPHFLETKITSFLSTNQIVCSCETRHFRSRYLYVFPTISLRKSPVFLGSSHSVFGASEREVDQTAVIRAQEK